MQTVPFQYELRPEISTIYGAVDYRNFRRILINIDRLLSNGLEQQIISNALERYVSANKQIDEKNFYCGKDSMFHYKKIRHALRCNIARHLTGESYRGFSIRLADSTLFQWFTNINDFSSQKGISKSSLERYEKYFDEEMLGRQIRKWLSTLNNIEEATKIGLENPIDYKNIFTDSTCVKANIHFPVDWVLLRDAARSLILAIKTIRSQGLKHRMIDPELFLKQMNKLCINMTHTRRKANSKKQRKIIFRQIKKLSCCIAKHGKRYRQLINEQWKKTEWTYAQTQQVLGRIDSILVQLPAAIKQAHERIIGEREVLAKNKILSLYDKDTHVIVRGKAGYEVEFGQGLVLTEQTDGLIIDWELFTGQPPSDNKLLKPTIMRLEQYYGVLDSYCTDRGFNNQSNDAFLRGRNIYNATCPKNPKQLQTKLFEPMFVALQTRRSQSEGRIGIFKNVFLGKPLRSKITAYKKIAITWSILTHDLWVLSRMAVDVEKSMLKKAA